jgi:hypothetical protein
MIGCNTSLNCKYIAVFQDSDDESYLDTLTEWAYCVIRVYYETKEITLWGWNQSHPQGEVNSQFSLKTGTDPLPEM